MRFKTQLRLAFTRLSRKISYASDRGLYQVAGLIRADARRSLKTSRTASTPGTPPKVRKGSGGLKEINFQVSSDKAIIGPRKFAGSNFFNRPVPNIHEKGGTAVGQSLRRSYIAQYPERSFMYASVRRLKQAGHIQSRFNITLRTNL